MRYVSRQPTVHLVFPSKGNQKSYKKLHNWPRLQLIFGCNAEPNIFPIFCASEKIQIIRFFAHFLGFQTYFQTTLEQILHEIEDSFIRSLNVIRCSFLQFEYKCHMHVKEPKIEMRIILSNGVEKKRGRYTFWKR